MRSRDSFSASPAHGSRRLLSVAIFATQPDVLYLQSTPMTEPLLLGLMLLAVDLVYDWVDANGRDKSPQAGRSARSSLPA